MTNNDELATNLKAAAEKAMPAIEKYEAGEIDGDDALEMLSDFTDVINPSNILALLAERDADKKRIAELEALTAEQDKRLIAYAAIATKNASEARTVSVKLNSPGIIKSPMGIQFEVWERVEVESAIGAAGIKLEVGE